VEFLIFGEIVFKNAIHCTFYYNQKIPSAMKNYFIFLSALLFFLNSCNKDELKGDQSPMGEVGNQVWSTSGELFGCSSMTGEVVTLDDGVSSYAGTAVVTNPTIKNILSNSPHCTVNDDEVMATNIKFKSTTEGIESVSGLAPGIIVKYDAEVGDEYPIGSTKKVRKVVRRSTEDDYLYGFFMIKVIEVEEYPGTMGVDKITYYANHRFGLAGIKFEFDDETTAWFPIYNTYENH
jgi:hypothetical protein